MKIDYCLYKKDTLGKGFGFFWEFNKKHFNTRCFGITIFILSIWIEF